MMTYYGNNYIELENNEILFNFKLLNGVEISITKKAYIITSIIFISCTYVVTLFVKKKKVIQKILAILLTIVAIITLLLFEKFSLLFSLTCAILLISEFIKHEKIKQIFKIVLFESYFFVIIQLIIPIIQYLIRLTQLWYKQ